MKSITYEDSQLVYELMLLPIVLTVLTRDLHTIEKSPLRMKKIYHDLLVKAIDSVHADMVKVKRELRKKGIKIYEEFRNDLGITCKYVCRGWHSEAMLIWSLVKIEVETRIRRYLCHASSM